MHYSWNGYLFFIKNNGRQPTAVPRMFDLTSVQQGRMSSQAKQILLENLKIQQKEDKSWKIEVPNFVTKDKFGYRELICEKYNRLTLVFQAEGVATHGERPSMTIEGNCSYSTEPMAKYLAPFEIPGSLFDRETPEDFNVLVGSNYQFWVRLTAMPNFWPEEWVLSSVRFYQSEKREEDLKWTGPFPQKMTWISNDSRNPASK